jgi:hypothetical protein
MTFDVEPAALRSRPLAFLGLLWPLRYAALVPVLVLTYGLGILIGAALWLAFVARLFTGRRPNGLAQLVVDGLRLLYQSTAFLYGLSDA